MMKKILFVLLAFFALNLSAQHTISGTFSPADDYTWLIAYRLKPGTQVYVADTAIKNGKFTLNIPETAESGTYRLVYAVPQEEYNFDVIYNGKEDIEFNFNSDNGASYIKSEENILLNEYLNKVNSVQEEMVAYYTSQETNEALYSTYSQRLNTIQKNYEVQTKELIAYNFINANKPYIPTNLETVQDYVFHKKEAYFKAIDFNNPVLQSSGFLSDKVANYVFTALRLTLNSEEEKESEITKNILTFNPLVENLSSTFKFHIYNDLWNLAVAYNYNTVSDFIFDYNLKKLALETDNLEIKNTIEVHNRLRLGAIAPEITWKKANEIQKLSALSNANTYVLIFWSSTCSHCLNELPALNKKLKGKPNVKILAVGLEDDTKNWELESSKLEGFEHAIALGKWDSEYANLYDIHATPTYFILDKEKRIIAKPENDKAVVEFLEKIH